NFIQGRITESGGQKLVTMPGGYSVPLGEEPEVKKGSEVTVSVRPESIDVLPAEERKTGFLSKVQAKAYLGNFLIYRLAGPEGLEFLVQTDPRVEYPEGSDVLLQIRDNRLRIF